MKKLLVITTLMAFMAAAPLAMAKSKPVKCCIKKECVDKATKAECTKAKGKVVSSCKKCK